MVLSKNISLYFSVVSILTTVCFSGLAFGQSSRTDAAGAPIGSLILYPSLEIGYGSNSNLYATNDNEIDDLIALLRPSLILKSDWSNHALEIGSTGESAYYSDKTDEDYSDYSLFADGRVDIMRGSNVAGGFSYDQLHEDRGSPDAAAGKTPTPYSTTGWDIGYSHAVSIISFQVKSSSTIYDFDDTETSSGRDINNETRNRTHFDFMGRVGYRLYKKYEAFVEAWYLSCEYDSASDVNGYNRSSTGSDYTAGISYNVSGVTSLEFALGYLANTYDDDRLEEISGYSTRGALQWTPSDITVLNGFVSRSIEETTLAGSSGYFASNYGVDVTHRFTDDIKVIGTASYSGLEYKGIDREDTVTFAEVELDYNLNRYLYLGVSYSYENFDSSEKDDSFVRNKGLAKVGLQI